MCVLCTLQFTFNVIVKQLLSIESGEPLASKILEDFLTFMQGFVSLPIYIPGTSYAKAVKVTNASEKYKKAKCLTA